MAGEASRLVGRGRELARLERALEEIGSSPPAVLQVVGEPGIGKTRLLAEAAAHAHARRYLVFTGRASEFERDLPFGAVVDALDPYLGSLSDRRLRPLSDDHRQELAGMFPALSELVEQRGSIVQHERYRSHHAVRKLLELLAAERPCVLILDDMHWADPASLELVGHLLRRRPEAPVLTLLGLRPAQASQRLLQQLELAEREGVSERLELLPLARSEIDELLGPSIVPALRSEVHRESGGNPFYAEQLGRALEGPALPGPGAAPAVPGVPRLVTDSLARELEQLPELARSVLQAAAVVGDPFEPRLVGSAASVAEDEILAALDELLAADLVRATDAPVLFRFRHPLVRRAVYESCRPGWRLAVHARCATALAAREAPPTVCAYHVERSARSGDEDAIALLSEAGHAAAPRAPAIAARWFQAALRLLPEGDGAGQRRLGLLAPLARALGSSGQLEASRRTLEEVLELLPEDAAPVRGQVIAFMSLVDHLLGRHGEARETLERALGELPDQGSPEAAALQAELAADCFFLGGWEGMRGWAEKARALALDLGDARTHAAAAALLALASYELARMEDARTYVAEAKRAVDGLSDEELTLRVDACHWLGWCEHLIDHYDDSIAHMERGIAISRRTGQGHVLAPMTIGLVIAHTWQGRLGEADRHAEEAIEMAHLAGSDQLMAWALTMRCWVSGRLGDLPAAVRAGEAAVEAARAVTRGPYSVVAACWLADALIESGAPVRGREQLLAAVDGPELPGVEHAFRACIYEVLTRAELADGRVDAAESWARRAEESVDGLELPGRASFAKRALASVALARGQPERAAELALAAADGAGDDYRLESARARTLAGRALAAAREKERAVAELVRARSELDQCGARRYSEQAVRELRRLGHHVGRSGRRGRGETGVPALSGRELEVAELVTDRMTNREIAERLVLSEKTVERHLANVFSKLGASSRVEVARAIEGFERPPSLERRAG